MMTQASSLYHLAWTPNSSLHLLSLPKQISPICGLKFI